jgi:hypothetical protein
MRPTTPALALVALAACGDTSLVNQQAAADYPTFRSLHEAVIAPTCGPRGGVCHNSKQFPDLHTPDNMLAAVGQRCNQLTEDPMAILDLCEPAGDRLLLQTGPDAGFSAPVGYVVAAGGVATLTLHDPVPHSAAGVTGVVIRDIDADHHMEVALGAVVTTRAGAASIAIPDLGALSAGLQYFLTSPYMPGFAGQIRGGDPNRNGTFGHDLGGALIKPGAAASSFLVLRILGVVLPRMPLANGTLTAEQVYAIECWIEQMDADGSNADGPIDYGRCPGSFPVPQP